MIGFHWDGTHLKGRFNPNHCRDFQTEFIIQVKALQLEKVPVPIIHNHVFILPPI